ncbi:MAG TPA: hypothetical protein VD838_11170 [Anaeromyxobacteraceae bacterium]|nr:hypothetical protein [Anaeromyxobacteraceae bacterium]
MAQRTVAGRPLVTPGAEAYLVWHDAAGWHLRARSDVARRFHGEIETGGERVTPVGGLAKESVVAGGGGIAFNFALEGGEAGFDWRDGGCQAFALYIDGDERPLRVFAGALGASPAKSPFSLCP